MKRLVLLVLLAVAALVVGAPAGAQQAPIDVQASADADVVEVGAPFRVTMRAMGTGGMPQSPSLGPVPGFDVEGPSTSTSTQVSIVNGRMTQSQGLTVVWQLVAKRTGRFTIGPPSVIFGSARYAAQPITVRVVPKGQAPPRPSARDPFGMNSPFDLWKSPFFQSQPDPDVGRDVEPTGPQVDPKLQLDAPRGARAFLHATVDKDSVVVGEQVTFTVYLYVDASASHNDYADPHEANIGDFVKQALVPDDSETRPLGYAMIQGRPWLVEPLRSWALFPIRTGTLEIGPMSVMIARPRIASPIRKSETLHVKVTEPPTAGRPPGYTLGDVGHFDVSADVSPREIEQNGAIAVTVDLSGTGNLPSSITVPVQSGVEWLDPQVRSQTGPQDGQIGGKRTFQYVVRLHRAGSIDLGEIAVPYWDPQSKRYAVARAPLGTVTVKPSSDPAPAASGDAKPEVLAGLPAVRTQLAGTGAAKRHFVDSRAYWLALGGAPLAWAVAFGASSAARSVRRRLASRAASPTREVRDRLAAAEAASKGSDSRAVDAAVVRAIESATVAYVGVNVRGARRDEVGALLVSGGAPREASQEIEAILRDCEDARFAPEAHSIDVARARHARAKRAIDAIRGAR